MIDRMRAPSLTVILFGAASLFASAGCSSPTTQDRSGVIPIKADWGFPLEGLDTRGIGRDSNPWGWTDRTASFDQGDDLSKFIPQYGGGEGDTTFLLGTVESHITDIDTSGFPPLTPDLTWAVHVRGSGFTQKGAHWGFLSGDSSLKGDDLRDYQGGGVVFWARKGDEADATTSIVVSVDGAAYKPADIDGGGDVGSDPLYHHCVAPSAPTGGPGVNYGGQDNQPFAATGVDNCYDVPNIAIPVTTTWRQYVLPFSIFVQNGYSRHVPGPWLEGGLDDPEGTSYVFFQIPKMIRFDFWIAGFGMYKRQDAPSNY